MTTEHPLTPADKAALGAYCNLAPERIVALHESVMVRDVRRSLVPHFVEPPEVVGEPYATVEVIYARKTGAVAAVRHRFATAAAFLDAVHAAHPRPAAA